jgi:hypothetical protein
MLLTIAFAGGGVAWTIHLIGSQIISEFACILGADEATLAGITLLAWALLALAAAMLLIAVGSALLAYRMIDRRNPLETPHEPPRMQMVRTGAVMNVVFALAILCQTIPILFFLDGC